MLIFWRIGGSKYIIPLLQSNSTMIKYIPIFIRVGTLQFVAIKPTIGVINLFFVYLGLNEDLYENRIQIILRLITLCSTIFALSCLLFLYRRTRDVISSFNTLEKFMVIKLCAFLPIVQELILNVIRNNQVLDHDGANQMYHTLVLIEMAPLAISDFNCFDLAELGNELECTKTPVFDSSSGEENKSE
eukprot:TRINITY_DN722_c0_g1_i12.p1 TRINITY_DN722_c0_g1~~TRINITY_DN722_c0_g1_i12.p1  ORF type:complete len:188 (-),score=20.77 TRINITY_DN722_c0_g1_i12:42-605(-)